jgi:branched-chain amino acid transport system substrate-binding protein
MLLPGITLNSSPCDYAIIQRMQLQRFNGTEWELFGSIK